MQTFARNKIALAVGASLLAMAGTATAAVAPAARTLQPALISAITAGVAEDLLTTAGANKALTIDLALTSGAAVVIPATGTSWTAAVIGAPSTATVTSSAGLAVGMAVTSAQALFPADAVILTVPNATSFTFSSATTAVPVSGAGANAATATGKAATVGGNVAASAALVINNATPANNNVIVYTGTTATPITVTSATLAAALAGGVSHVTIALPAPGAGKAYRLTTAGALEYSADAGVTWAAVKVDVQDVAAGTRLYTDMDNVAGFNAAATPGDIVAVALTGIAVGNSIAPTPVLATTGAPTAAAPLINGISVDTVVPISSFTIVTGVAVTPNNNAGQIAAIHAVTPFSAVPTPGAAWTATSATGTLGVAVAATATKPPTFKNTLAFLPAADWTSGAAADDLIYAASPVALNTGIQGAALPVTLTVGSTPPTYTTVFSTVDGTPALVSYAAGLAAAGKIGDGTSTTDGVAPILISAATNAGAKTLSLKFSEPMTIFDTVPGDGLREIAENVLSASDSLAALNLNSNGTLSIPGAGAIAPTAGQSTLVITDTTTALVTNTVGKTITVNTGIFFGENNDGTGATVKTTQDVGGGLKSSSLAVEGASGAQAAAAAVLNVAFDATNSVNTTARASTGADATKVATIQVKFPAAGAVAFATGKTVADLAGQIVVHVTGYATSGAPVQWDFFPNAAQMTLTNSTTLDITIPTALLYSKAASNIAMNLKYLNNPGGGVAGPNVLVAASLATDIVDASTGGLTVVIPFAAAGATSSLLTQSIIGTLASATSVNGDKVEAYVAKWEDAPATTGIARTVSGGVINGAPVSFSGTNGSAVWGTGSGSAALELKLDDEEAKVKAAEVAGISAATNAGVPPTVYVASMYGTAYVSSLSAADALATATSGASGANNAITSAASSAGFTGAVATGAGGRGITTNGNNNTETNIGATQTSSQAAIQAGVAAALAAVVKTAGVPAVAVNAARAAAMAPNATIASVVNAVLGAKQSPVVVPVTVGFDGSIKGAGVSGSFAVTKTAGSVGTRGLVFIKNDGTDQATAAAAGTWASGVVGTVNGVADSYNLLLGIEPSAADIALKKNKNWFVLLLHTPGTAATAADLNMLTSAHPLATNFVPFSANLVSGLGTRTTLSTDLSKIKKLAPATSTNWALYGMGSPGTNATAPVGHNPHFVRWFVGIKNATSQPASFWTSDGAGTDVALTMKANAVSVATELGTNKGTLSTIQTPSFVNGAPAVAWKNDAAGVTNDHLDILQAGTPAAGSIKVNTGWSLVTVPASMAAAVPAAVGAVIKVGAQVSSGYTWIKATDAATTPLPSLTAGEAVFVYSTCPLVAGCPIN